MIKRHFLLLGAAVLVGLMTVAVVMRLAFADDGGGRGGPGGPGGGLGGPGGELPPELMEQIQRQLQQAASMM